VSSCSIIATLLLHILMNPMPCGMDGHLGDAHDTANIAVFQAHLVETEEEGFSIVSCCLGHFLYLCSRKHM